MIVFERQMIRGFVIQPGAMMTGIPTTHAHSFPKQLFRVLVDPTSFVYLFFKLLTMTKQEFWDWFEKNASALETFISREPRDYAIYEALSDRLKQFNKYLIPELTMDDKNNFILILSCDGNRKGIPALENLAEGIGKYDNWKIVKYRQPDPMEFIPLNGHKLKRKDILLLWNRATNEKYQLTFYKKWYTPKRIYDLGAALHLDHTIGEYNSMTKIEDVKVVPLGPFQSKARLKTLDELKAEIDAD